VKRREERDYEVIFFTSFPPLRDRGEGGRGKGSMGQGKGEKKEED